MVVSKIIEPQHLPHFAEPQVTRVTNTTTPPSSLVDVTQLATALEQFASDRNWAQFHSPKNLAMALSGEVGELTEIFQWMTEDASKEAARISWVTASLASVATNCVA